MRVLALDPGAVNIGWAVLIEGELEDYGVFHPTVTKEKFNDKVSEALPQIWKHFEELILLHKIDTAIAETVPSFGAFSQRDRVVATAITFKNIAYQHSLRYTEVQPRSVKLETVGSAKAEKKEIREWVWEKFPDCEGDPTKLFDSYDAIAIGSLADKSGREWFDWEGTSDELTTVQ